MGQSITVTVNGTSHTGEVEPRLLLAQYLRETLNMTGTHIGCDTSNCGACTVVLNGNAVKSCTVFAVQADGGKVTTVEGLAAANGDLHAVQEGFWEKHGLQCGFCTPGMIMMSYDLLLQEPQPFGRGDSRRSRRQPLPLHRLPQHRQRRPVRRRKDVVIRVSQSIGWSVRQSPPNKKGWDKTERPTY